MNYFTRNNAARLKTHTIKLLILIFVSRLLLRIKKRKRGIGISFEEKPATEKREDQNEKVYTNRPPRGSSTVVMNQQLK
jgi:hypothetical protein